MGEHKYTPEMPDRHGARHAHFGRQRTRGFGGEAGFDPRAWSGFGRGGGGRMRRGGMQVALLALLAEEPMHGYQIIQELANRSGGAWTPGAGSVYPALEQMEALGLITGEQQEDKRVYTITDKGRELAQRVPAHGRARPDQRHNPAHRRRAPRKDPPPAPHRARGQVPASRNLQAPWPGNGRART